MKNTITVMLQKETIEALNKVQQGTVSYQSARLGVFEGEPLLVAFDAMLSYAKAYKARFESPVAEDGYLGEQYENVLFALHNMLNGDGAVAMRRGITTDSKDNGVLEKIYWDCREAAGIDKEKNV